MNRKILITTLSLSCAASVMAYAQNTNADAHLSLPGPETNADVGLDWSAFQSLAQKNIFDPTRSGHSRLDANIKKATVIYTFTFRGTVDDAGFFTGEGAPGKGYVRAGDTINGFKVLKVTLDAVTLAQPSGDIIVLQADDTMRREDEGAWTKSDQPPPPVGISSSGSGGTSVDSSSSSSSTPSSAGPAGESDILKKLRLKREQEEK